MGAFVRNHTTGTSASGTSVTATLAADVNAGNLLVCWVAMDNTGTTTPTVSSIDKPGGESATWARVASHDSSTATSAGGVRGELWVIRTTQLWASGTVITATLSASPPKSHMLCQEHTQVLATVRGTAGTSTSTTGAVSAATSGTALAAGDLVIGAATFETSTTPTGDADTTNGSWSTALTGNTGGGASASQVSSVLQYKYVTATGVQTYNPTAGSTDSGAAVVGLQFDPNTTVTAGAATVSFTAADATAVIPSPVIVLAADAITGLVDADPVASWADTSGSANTVTQATATNQPSYRTAAQNSLPVVRFGGDDRLTKGSAPTGTATQNFTVVAAVKPTTITGANRTIIAVGDGNGGRQWRLKATGEQNLVKTNTADLATGTTQHAAGTFVVLAITYAADGTISFYKTGNTADGGATAVANFTDAFPDLSVGAHLDGPTVEPWIGDIAELRWWPRVLTSGERAAQFTDLEGKWISSGAAASADPATVSFAAADAAATVGVNADTATVPIVAADATSAVVANADPATVGFAAADATVSTSGSTTAAAGPATVGFVAADAAAAVVVAADAATVPVTAADATVSTAGATATVGIGAIRWVAAAATTAPAGTTTAPVTAADATVTLAVAAGTAAVPLVAADAAAAVVVSAGAASVGFAAADATVALAVDAGTAVVPVAAADAQSALTVDAGSASVPVVAADASVSTSGTTVATAGAATVSFVAADATVALGVAAEAATVPLAAADATVSTVTQTTAPAGSAVVPVTAADASAAVTVSADPATVSFAAADATVSTLTQTTANADPATVPVTAADASVAVVVSADPATVGFTATDASVPAAPDAGSATVPLVAADATVAVVVQAGAASLSFAAADATFARYTDAAAGSATITIGAADATTSVAAAAGSASVPFTAADPTVFVPPPVPPPRWVEGASVASGLVEGDSSGNGQVEGVLVGAGIVEGGSSL